MIVDVARTARKTIMYFFELPTPRASTSLPGVLPDAARAAFGMYAATKRETRVRWYKAPPGAKRLPVENAFMLADWYSNYERCDMTTGEDPWQRWQYDKGQAPQGATGQSFCGTAADFYAAKPWEPDPAKRRTLMRGPTGLPICCNPALRGAIGWIAKPPPPLQTGLGLGVQHVQATRYAMGLQNYAYSGWCPGSNMPLLLKVKFTAPAYPLLDGLVLWVPMDVTSHSTFTRWLAIFQTAAGPLAISISGNNLTLPSPSVHWEFKLGDFVTPTSYIFADSSTPIFPSCSPMSFNSTEPLFQYPGFMPTGNDLTLDVG